MSKKHKKRIEEIVEIDPEKDMPLPERLKVENDSPTVTEEPEIKASETKQVQPQPEVVEPGYFSTKVERYRR